MSLKRKAFDSDSIEVVESKQAKNTLVSFTKRRQGLFRKASELCSKFDAQIAILVLSPSENPFSFGHSSVDDVIRRYDSLVGRTTAVVGEEARAVNESRRMRQEGELEALRVRVKEKERDRREIRSNPSTADRLINVENCESVEELEGFKVKCLALLQLIREKLRRNDSSFLYSGTGSGSFNVAGNNSNLLDHQENDMSFPVMKYESDSGFDYVTAGSVMTTVDLANGNDVSFSLPMYGDYGGSCSSGCSVFGSLGADSPEVMVDKQNYLLPADGSNGGSNNNNNDDSFNFADQRSYGTGVGDENLGFCPYEDNNFLHGQENDMSFFQAMSDDNSFGPMYTGGFGFVGGESSFWR